MCAIKIKGLQELSRLLDNIDVEVDKIVKEVLLLSANEILQDALSRLPSGSGNVRSSFAIEVDDDGWKCIIYSDEEVAAYIEFGTGDFAKAYLAGKPREIVDEAIKFYIDGSLKMPSQPYLFHAYLSRIDKIV